MPALNREEGYLVRDALYVVASVVPNVEIEAVGVAQSLCLEWRVAIWDQDKKHVMRLDVDRKDNSVLFHAAIELEEQELYAPICAGLNDSKAVLYIDPWNHYSERAYLGKKYEYGMEFRTDLRTMNIAKAVKTFVELYRRTIHGAPHEHSPIT